MRAAELINRFTRQLPEFEEDYRRLCLEFGDEAAVPVCIAFGGLVNLLIAWSAQGCEEKLAVAFAEVEWIMNSSPDAQERALLAVCLLEALQNASLIDSSKYLRMKERLGPSTLRCWDEIENFWEDEALFPQLIPDLWTQMSVTMGTIRRWCSNALAQLLKTGLGGLR